MWYDTSFFVNPFENPNYSRARKLLFAYDQVARLTALDAGLFGPRISATQAAAEALSTAGSATGAATGTQRGVTLGTDAQLQAYRKVVGGKYNVLLDRFGGNKQAPLLITLFGASVQTYTSELTKTNAKTRLETLNQLLEANATETGADIVKAITDAAGAYLGTRKQQLRDKGTTSVAQLAETTHEAALDQALWLNLAAVVAAYPTPAQAPQRHAAADFSLLQRHAVGPQPHTETGTVAPDAVVNLVNEGLRPNTPLRLRNPGPVLLHFALSDAPNRMGPSIRVVLPGQTLALPASDLGDSTLLPCLNVYLPASSSQPGQYEVTVG